MRLKICWTVHLSLKNSFPVKENYNFDVSCQIIAYLKKLLYLRLFRLSRFNFKRVSQNLLSAASTCQTVVK